jgi:hypothetical protein
VEPAIVATANAASPIFFKLNMDVSLKADRPPTSTSWQQPMFLDLGVKIYFNSRSGGE